MTKITNEIIALRVMFNKFKYLKYRKYFENMELEAEHRLVFETLGDYFEENTSVEDVDVVDFTLYLGLKHPLEKNKDVIIDTLNTVAKATVLESTVTTIMRQLIRKHYAADIINELTPVLDDSAEEDVMDEVYALLSNFEESVEHLTSDKEKEERYVTHDLDDLLESEVLGTGLAWRLHCLNYDIGALRGGSLGHVFARPDTGKTTFLASEVSFFASQLENDEKILWFNNEEKGKKVQLRVYSAVTGMSKASIAMNKEDVKEQFSNKGGDRIQVFDRAIIDIRDIRKELEENNVRVVVIDQADKLHFRGQGDMADHLRLKSIYNKLRELAKEFEVEIITAGQADNAAEGQKWLRLNNMDGSKVGKPGELDYAIGIGVDPSGLEYARFISVCKNKMKDGRHGNWQTTIDVMSARYLDKEKSVNEIEPSAVVGDIPLAMAA